MGNSFTKEPQNRDKSISRSVLIYYIYSTNMYCRAYFYRELWGSYIKTCSYWWEKVLKYQFELKTVLIAGP